MATTKKYTVNAGGSGWGVWDVDGRKVASFTSRPIGRYQALRYLYMLNGWNWESSRYVRTQPWLRDIDIDVLA